MWDNRSRMLSITVLIMRFDPLADVSRFVPGGLDEAVYIGLYEPTSYAYDEKSMT